MEIDAHQYPHLHSFCFAQERRNFPNGYVHVPNVKDFTQIPHPFPHGY